MLLTVKSKNKKENSHVKGRKNKIFLIILSLLFLTAHVYAESTNQANSIFSVGDTQFKILNVYVGKGLNRGGMILAPTGMTDEQACLIIEVEEIAGSIPKIIKGVTNEKNVMFDNKACVSLNNISQCAIAVNKSSHSFTLNFSNGKSINLSSFIK